MRITIGARIWLITIVALAALAAITILNLWNLERSRDVGALVERGQSVLLRMTELLADVTDAETGQRGFIITGDPKYLDAYKLAVKKVPALIETVHALVSNDPPQHARLERLEHPIERKFAELAETIELRSSSGVAAATAVVMQDRGKVLMDEIRALVAEMISNQQAEVKVAEDEVVAIRATAAPLMLLGGIALILILTLATSRTIFLIREPLKLMIEGAENIGSGRLDHRIPVARQDEFGELAKHFNTMAATLGEERQKREGVERNILGLNEELTARATQLERGSSIIDLLGKMSHRLQSCISEEEIAAVVERFAPQIAPQHAGTFFLYNNSRTLLQMRASWNGATGSVLDFLPDDCWALRRGQAHIVTDQGKELVCRHINGAAVTSYTCLPLTGHGSIIGLLCFEHPRTEAGGEPAPLDVEQLSVLSENLALAIANYRLQETLRVQSVRDPLSGLFNRRYLEETLELEFARAARAQSAVAVVMIDVDHFKRFNDSFGHDAGDFVLRRIGEALRDNIRDGDVACRYGGEEFTVVLPGAGAAAAAARAETMRNAVRALAVTHHGTSLGQLSISLGVALYPVHGTSPGLVMEAADQALLRAKQNGRDCVELAASPPLAAATAASPRQHA